MLRSVRRLKPDLETILLGVVYWLSRVLDLTGVRGGMNTILSWLLFDEEAAALLAAVAAASLEVCEPPAVPVESSRLPDADAAAAAFALFLVVHRLGIMKLLESTVLCVDEDSLALHEYDEETDRDSDDDDDDDEELDS